MRSTVLTWRCAGDWAKDVDALSSADVVICFGPRDKLEDGTARRELAEQAKSAILIGCSTGGQFSGDEIRDSDIVALAMRFDSTAVRGVSFRREDGESDAELGTRIGKGLHGDTLAGVFILSDGTNINGSSLISGLLGVLGADIPVTGGLAGDGADFRQTFVFGPGTGGTDVAAAVGFYGTAIRIGHGSFGGWQYFGPRRVVTRSAGNVLFELDGKPALDLYQRYLTPEEIEGLPASALLFPLLIGDPAVPDHEIVRTVLAVDRDTRAMTFAGDVPEGWSARLMHGVFDELNAGAGKAAYAARHMLPQGRQPDASILISCIGRRLLLGQNTSEELKAVLAQIGAQSPAIGFYSYGEISPHGVSGRCDIHNQTMTVTSFVEDAE